MEHRHIIRVRYAESDQMGVAHHSAIVPWLEEARIEWLRARGLSYRELEASGLLMPVVELSVRYRRSLRFDDQAELRTRVEVKGPSRLAFLTAVHLDSMLCADAVVVVAATDRVGRPVRLPAALVAKSDT